MSYWQGKRAVVTGGTSGLGRAIAQTLLENGARVAIVGRDRGKLDETLSEFKTIRDDVLGISADVTSAEDVSRLSSTVLRAWGGVDALYHCAGRSMRGTALGTSPDEYRQLWEANFVSAVRCVQAFSQSLVERRGHVVLIGSLASKVAPKFLGAYPAAKFSLAAFAQQLRLENGPQGLHTLLVCPGPIAREELSGSNGRYASEAPDLPAEAHRPAGGAKLRAIDPRWLAEEILKATEHRRAELIVPARSRLLFIASQISPTFGDWLLRKMTSG
jgi:NAD(P)-dependent dehydrogenase (short-subunit alcohol dehydrogenase family)